MSREHQVGFDGALDQAAPVDESFEVRPLDDVVRGSVAVLKLDVEGMEEAVLQGAERILRQHRPVVFAEAQSEGHRAAIESALAPHGYTATGRVFNSSPTYEFIAPPVAPSLFRRAVRRLPTPARVALRRLVTRLARVKRWVVTSWPANLEAPTRHLR